MRKSPLLSCLTLGLFLLVPPVHAVNYTGEAWLDWTSLKFSGIPITMTTDRFQEISTRAIPLDHPNQGFVAKNDHFHNWSDHASTATMPSVTSMSIADANRLYASVNLSGPAFGEAFLHRQGGFIATDTGNLTVSFDYTLQQIGVASLGQSVFASQAPTVAIGIHNGMFGEASSVGEFKPVVLSDLIGNFNDGVQTGTLSLTRPFQSGEPGYFYAEALLNATTQPAGSVPVPDMLWLTLAGMIGIAFWAERRRQQTRLTR